MHLTLTDNILILTRSNPLAKQIVLVYICGAPRLLWADAMQRVLLMKNIAKGSRWFELHFC